MEGMTLEELLAWANRLGICEFRPSKDVGREAIVCERGKSRILLEFGRYTKRAGNGARFVSVHARVGTSGMTRPCDTLDEACQAIGIWADRGGLRNDAMQLSMF